MKKIIATAAIAATIAVSASPASAQMSGFKSMNPAASADNLIEKTGRRGRRGRRIGAGIALGLIGAAVIAGHASRHGDYYEDRYSRHERRCNRWRRWCRNGEDRACWKYENRC
jgi:Ni/Co efflux regulator RcnB